MCAMCNEILKSLHWYHFYEITPLEDLGRLQKGVVQCAYLKSTPLLELCGDCRRVWSNVLM